MYAWRLMCDTTKKEGMEWFLILLLNNEIINLYLRGSVFFCLIFMEIGFYVSEKN